MKPKSPTDTTKSCTRNHDHPSAGYVVCSHIAAGRAKPAIVIPPTETSHGLLACAEGIPHALSELEDAYCACCSLARGWLDNPTTPEACDPAGLNARTPSAVAERPARTGGTDDMDKTNCPICRGVRLRGEDPEDVLGRHLGRQTTLTADPPEAVATVRDRVASEVCAEHRALVLGLARRRRARARAAEQPRRGTALNVRAVRVPRRT